MKQRHEELLKLIIEAYTDTAEPIGSKLVAGDLGLSSATLRNEMMELEELGYLHQPHTSAGRVPTEKGYKFYLDKFAYNKKLGVREQKCLSDLWNQQSDTTSSIKSVAKKMAEISEQTIIIAFHPNNIYYTGVANLFSKPEFIKDSAVSHLSVVIDKLEDGVNKVYNDISDKIHVLIGRDNPLSSDCSLVASRYMWVNDEALVGIFGPMRMDYAKNISLLEFVRDNLK